MLPIQKDKELKYFQINYFILQNMWIYNNDFEFQFKLYEVIWKHLVKLYS